MIYNAVAGSAISRDWISSKFKRGGLLVENTLSIVLIIYPLGPTEAIYTNLRANFEEDSSDGWMDNYYYY
jgi:hypothetical protein